MNIFITWVSSWIGRNLLEKYIESWNKVYGVVRTEKQKEEIITKYSKSEIYVCDLSDISQIEKLWKKIQKETFDIMIFNAWYWEYKNFSKHSEHEILNQILVNFYSPISIISNYIKNDLSNNTKIVLISSIVWSMPIKNLSIYGSTKWWLSHFYRVWRKENSNIKSLCLELWSTKTPMHTKSGMKNMKWRELIKVSSKIIKYIETKQWVRHIYLDWWLIAKLWNIIK